MLIAWSMQVAGIAAAGCALLALTTTGAWRWSYALLAYLAVDTAGDTARLFLPGIADTALVWVLRQAAHEALRLLMAWELASVLWERLPRVQCQARMLWLAALPPACFVLWLSATRDGVGYSAAAMMGAVCACLLLGLRALAFFYHLPLHPVVEVVLSGMPPYLLARAALAGWAMETNPGWWTWASPAQAVAFSVLMLSLAHAAWRGHTWRPPDRLMPRRLRMVKPT